ncbi:hypothetical protein ACWGSC_32355, partial [Streptomyces sp. NPDC055642]
MTGLIERLVPDELWTLFQRVVPPTEVIRPQGGERRRAIRTRPEPFPITLITGVRPRRDHVRPFAGFR